MTENEAINYLRQINPKHIECVELVDMKEVWDNIPQSVSIAEEALKEIQQYRAIGTVEECREARERQRVKKPNIITGKTEKDKLACCPICESNLDWTYDGFWRKGNPKYCSNCGQAIDWSDTN